MSKVTTRQTKTVASESDDHIKELLETMEQAGIVEEYLDKNGEKCFRLTDSAWSQLDEEK